MQKEKGISQELDSKSFEELLYIYFYKEKYILKLTENNKKENNKLYSKIEDKINEIEYLKEDINKLKDKLSDLINQNNNKKQDYNILEIITKKKQKLDKEFTDKRRILLNKLKSNEITYNQFNYEFKEFDEKYFYSKIALEALQNNIYK